MGTKLNPGRFDCYANAHPTEPMFILLARDPHAPDTVRDWATRRAASIRAGEKPATDWPMVTEAYQCADLMADWRVGNAPGRAAGELHPGGRMMLDISGQAASGKSTLLQLLPRLGYRVKLLEDGDGQDGKTVAIVEWGSVPMTAERPRPYVPLSTGELREFRRRFPHLCKMHRHPDGNARRYPPEARALLASRSEKKGGRK
jgi:hypothetical protein